MDPRLRAIDECLFADRSRRRGQPARRSLARARELWRLLGMPEMLERAALPQITVVGSKGKGTAATVASATLAAAGLTVGLLTSPGLRSNRERIRVDGQAMRPGAYAQQVSRLCGELERWSEALPEDGYLAPTGLFTLLAVRHFLEQRVDAIVLEAGMGGGSDEVSLTSPTVVAVTPVFGEHLGILGDSIAEIAREKLGVLRDGTRAVVSLRQADAGARSELTRLAGDHGLELVTPEPDASRWPRGLGQINARIGQRAALRLLAASGVATPEASCLTRALNSVSLPGRLSVHQHGGSRWLLDAAINGEGAAAALALCRELLGPPDAVLLCLPDDKPDGAGVAAALQGLRVLPVRLQAPHLHFDTWSAGSPQLAEVLRRPVGERVLALGTVSFVGEMLDWLEVDTQTAHAPARELSQAG